MKKKPTFHSASTTLRILALAGILLAVSAACAAGQNARSAVGGPIVSLASPLPGQTARVGEPISVDSTSVDADGVARIELWVDDTLVRVDSNPDVNSPYIVKQLWQSDEPGAHVIQVRAFDAQETEGRSEPITITLVTAAQPAPQPTEAAHLSPTPDELPASVTPNQPAPTTAPAPTLPPAATATSTPPSATPTGTPVVACTPPPCKPGEVYHCPDVCPGGCGTGCATPTPTATPPSFKPTGIEPHVIFEPVWAQSEIKDYLGYPTEQASDDRPYARQFFERGYLYWWDRPDAPGLIWAMEIPQPGARKGFDWSGPYEDTWDGDDTHACDAARANPGGPVRGFGKLWCENPEIAEGIGAARGPEQGTGSTASYGVVQHFQGGWLLYSPLDQEIWVLFEGGAWQRHARQPQ